MQRIESLDTTMERGFAFLAAMPEPNEHGPEFCAAWDELDGKETVLEETRLLVRDAERYRFVVRSSRRQWPSLWRYATFRVCYFVGDPIRLFGEAHGLPRLVDLGCDIVWFGFQVRDAGHETI